MEKKVRFYNRLYFRIFSVFGLSASVLVLLIGVVFFKLYSINVIEGFKSQLESNAAEIANRVRYYAIEGEDSGYADYIDATQALLESQTVDVWVMSYYKAGENKLKNKYVNTSIKYKNLSPGMKSVMRKVYKKAEVCSNMNYDEIYEKELIRAGAPIYDAGGNVIGGVLLNSVAQGRTEIVNNGRKIVMLCLIIAWSASIILAMLLSGQMSDPISKIRNTTTRLAEGDYSAKTGIRSSGEIGELAETVDILSDRLEVTEQERVDFFANVSHELRTPITVMRGYTETLADGVITDPERIQYTYTRMLSECNGMERLVSDLLALSKLQNPDFKIEKEPLSLVQIFEDVTKNAKVLGENKNIKIKFETDDEYCFMLGDYDRLRQMFMIIIDNAIKFSHVGSSVEISIHKGDRLYVKIRDHGIGIEEDMLPHIFNKFYKSKLQMNHTGSGLGLVIAKQIAMNHNAGIKVESIVGVGTTFIFDFEPADVPEDDYMDIDDIDMDNSDVDDIDERED